MTISQVQVNLILWPVGTDGALGFRRSLLLLICREWGVREAVRREG